MSGQSPSRRQVLQAFSLAAIAAAAPGFSRWCYALGKAEPLPALGGGSGGAYMPKFFTPQEYRTVEMLAELILPSDQGPGAKEAGVAEFIDFMVQNDSSLHDPFLSGLAWLGGAAGSQRLFAGLPRAEQTQILDRLAYKNYQRADEKAGQEFFKLARQYAVMGFYTTKIGLEALDFPGLRFYGTSPGCNHAPEADHTGI